MDLKSVKLVISSIEEANMNIEFIKNPDTGILEAWEDGRVIGEFIPTGMMIKGWKLTDCIVRTELGVGAENKG